MGKGKKTVVIAGVATLLTGGVLVGIGQTSGDNPNDFPDFNSNPGLTVNDLVGDKKADEKKAEEKKPEAKKEEPKKSEDNRADVEVSGGAVTNLTDNRSDVIADYCRNSKLPPGEGKDNKGGTCVSYPIGEVAKNPVLVGFTNPPSVVGADKPFELKVRVEDKFGPLDLNAFTHDENDKAGDTFLEHPGALDKDGRPLIHAHVGITTLTDDGMPGQTYDAAFSGLQGVKGNLTAKIGGLQPGNYRVDVYVGQPGHAPLPTAKADFTQAFASITIRVR